MKRMISLLLLAGFFYTTASSQSSSYTPSFVAITVRNIDSSIQWYRSLLGLHIRNRVDNAERGFKQAVLINDNTMIELVEQVKAISRDSVLGHYPKGTRLHGVSKFGFTVPDIDKLYEQHLNSGMKMLGTLVTDPVDKRRTYLILDPDGNIVQFFGK